MRLAVKLKFSRTGWFQCVLASKLANFGCTCQFRIAVAVTLEVRRVLWSAAILLGCFKWLNQGLVVPLRKRQPITFTLALCFMRSVPLVNRPLTSAASPAKFGCVVLVVAAVGFSEQSLRWRR